jgi:hypothetical protein
MYENGCSSGILACHGRGPDSIPDMRFVFHYRHLMDDDEELLLHDLLEERANRQRKISRKNKKGQRHKEKKEKKNRKEERYKES